MSIDSLQSNPWANPWAASVASQSGSNATGTAAPTGPYAEILQEQTNFHHVERQCTLVQPGCSRDQRHDASSPANPLQSLASDIQAMLIQAQSSAAASGTTGSTTAAASAAAERGD